MNVKRIKICLPGVLTIGLIVVLSTGLTTIGGIMPAGSEVAGRSIGDYGADWWNWALIEPAETNPILDTTGELANSNQGGWEGTLPVFFLAGTFGSAEERSFTVPDDKYVFIPLINAWTSRVNATDPAEDIIAETRGLIDLIDSLHLSIDGVAVPEAELFLHREEASDLFTISAGENNVIGVTPGVYPGTWASGYYIMLEPLSPGEHVIEYGGAITDWGFAVDVTANILVPEPATFMVLGLGSVMLLRRKK